MTTPATPALQVQGLGLTIGGATILEDVDLEVERGSFIGVIGPNGAGKTTLFNVVSGITRPTSGTVHLDGRDVTGTSVHRRARAGLGRTFQTSSLFPQLTVRENVRIAAQVGLGGSLSPFRFPRLGDRATREAEEHLGEVGLGDKLDLPAGSLSHGDKRKLEIAVLRATDADVVLWAPATSPGSPTPSAGCTARRARRSSWSSTTWRCCSASSTRSRSCTSARSSPSTPPRP